MYIVHVWILETDLSRPLHSCLHFCIFPFFKKKRTQIKQLESQGIPAHLFLGLSASVCLVSCSTDDATVCDYCQIVMCTCTQLFFCSSTEICKCELKCKSMQHHATSKNKLKRVCHFITSCCLFEIVGMLMMLSMSVLYTLW